MPSMKSASISLPSPAGAIRVRRRGRNARVPGKARRDGTTEGMAAELDLAEGEAIEEGGDRLDEILQSGGCDRRGAVRRQVRRQHLPSLAGEPGGEALPGRRVAAEAVQQEKRRRAGGVPFAIGDASRREVAGEENGPSAGTVSARPEPCADEVFDILRLHAGAAAAARHRGDVDAVLAGDAASERRRADAIGSLVRPERPLRVPRERGRCGGVSVAGVPAAAASPAPS